MAVEAIEADAARVVHEEGGFAFVVPGRVLINPGTREEELRVVGPGGVARDAEGLRVGGNPLGRRGVQRGVGRLGGSSLRLADGLEPGGGERGEVCPPVVGEAREDDVAVTFNLAVVAGVVAQLADELAARVWEQEMLPTPDRRVH